MASLKDLAAVGEGDGWSTSHFKIDKARQQHSDWQVLLQSQLGPQPWRNIQISAFCTAAAFPRNTVLVTDDLCYGCDLACSTPNISGVKFPVGRPCSLVLL